MEFTDVIAMFGSAPKYNSLKLTQRNDYSQKTESYEEEPIEPPQTNSDGSYNYNKASWDDKALKYALLDAQIDTESLWDPRAERDEGEHGVSKGVAQFLPGTWDFAKKQGWIGQDADPYDTETSLQAQQKYMDYLYEKAGGTNDEDRILRTVAAYNAGPELVEQTGGVPPVPETRRFVERVLRYYREYLNIR